MVEPLVDHSDSRTFRRTTETPRDARAFLARSLPTGGGDGLLENAALLVSELVANAIVHTSSDQVVVEVVTTGAGRLRCTVIDQAPGTRPTIQPVDVSTVGGNGLAIVDRVATRWGYDRDATTKSVWFELDDR